MLTFNHEELRPCKVTCTGSCTRMLLYTLDKLFHIFWGVGANDLNGRGVVAYEILSFASVCCTEQQGKPKKCCNTHGKAAVRVDLNDPDGLEHLAWVIYDGVFLPGDPPMLTGYHDWQWIIAGNMLRLIYRGPTADEHCPPCTVASLNAERAMKEATQQQGPTRHPKKFCTPTIRSIVNVPLRAASSCSAEGQQPHHWTTAERKTKRMGPFTNFIIAECSKAART